LKRLRPIDFLHEILDYYDIEKEIRQNFSLQGNNSERMVWLFLEKDQANNRKTSKDFLKRRKRTLEDDERIYGKFL